MASGEQALIEVPRFELSLLGGSSEKRYRALRPEIEAMPWEALDAVALPAPLRAHGRRFWTVAALQEFRTGAAIAAVAEALIAARAPLDLVALAGRFIVDEVAHTELCARVAAALGGAHPIRYDEAALFARPDPALPAIERAAELIVGVFCVGEAFSVGMQRATARAERHPLFKAVWSRIGRDEAEHGAFGWLFLDWADDHLDPARRPRLRAIAAAAVEAMRRMAESQGGSAGPDGTLGWLDGQRYRQIAPGVLERNVLRPLRARDLL